MNLIEKGSDRYIHIYFKKFEQTKGNVGCVSYMIRDSLSWREKPFQIEARNSNTQIMIELQEMNFKLISLKKDILLDFVITKI